MSAQSSLLDLFGVAEPLGKVDNGGRMG
jgi:hypothetical protein